jgi:hypothetical protein
MTLPGLALEVEAAVHQEARAIKHAPHDPHVMGDEVLAVGDERFRQKCHARMEDVRPRGTTVVLGWQPSAR